MKVNFVEIDNDTFGFYLDYGKEKLIFGIVNNDYDYSTDYGVKDDYSLKVLSSLNGEIEPSGETGTISGFLDDRVEDALLQAVEKNIASRNVNNEEAFLDNFEEVEFLDAYDLEDITDEDKINEITNIKDLLILKVTLSSAESKRFKTPIEEISNIIIDNNKLIDSYKDNKSISDLIDRISDIDNSSKIELSNVKGLSRENKKTPRNT